MSSKKFLTAEEIKEIIFLNVATGLKPSEIKDRVGRSAQAVSSTINMYNAIAAEDWDEVKRLITAANCSMYKVNACAEAAGKKVPEDIAKYHTADRADRRYRAKAANPDQITIDERQIPEQPEEKKLTDNEELFFVRILKALGQLIEEQEKTNAKIDEEIIVLKKQSDMIAMIAMDTIPRVERLLREGMNTNTDVLVQQMKHCSDAMESVRTTIKKKGI